MQRLSVSIQRGCGKEGVVSPAFMLQRMRTSSSGARRMHCQMKTRTSKNQRSFRKWPWETHCLRLKYLARIKVDRHIPQRNLLLWCRGISQQPATVRNYACLYYLLVESMPLGMLLVLSSWDKLLTDGERPMFADKEACFQE